jgi:phytoene dehydrogenase-like protein
VEPAQALAELTELSSQIRLAVLLDEDGGVVAANAESGGAEALAHAARELVARAAELHANEEVTRVEVELAEGGVFVLREGGRTIAATTGPEPTAGLVVYDLRTCLNGIDPPKPKRRSRKPKAESA